MAITPAGSGRCCRASVSPRRRNGGERRCPARRRRSPCPSTGAAGGDGLLAAARFRWFSRRRRRSAARSRRRRGATLFMALEARLRRLLSRLGGDDDLVVGTVTAGRPRAELEHARRLLRQHPGAAPSHRPFGVLRDARWRRRGRPFSTLSITSMRPSPPWSMRCGRRGRSAMRRSSR